MKSNSKHALSISRYLHFVRPFSSHSLYSKGKEKQRTDFEQSFYRGKCKLSTCRNPWKPLHFQSEPRFNSYIFFVMLCVVVTFTLVLIKWQYSIVQCTKWLQVLNLVYYHLHKACYEKCPMGILLLYFG